MVSKNHILLFYPRFNTETYSGPPKNLPLPMPLLFLANPLLERGFKVTLVDERVEDYRAKIRELKDELLLCGVSCMPPQIKDGLEFSRFVKATDDSIRVAWGGWHPTVFPTQTTADSAIDFVIRGDGEATLTELCCKLKDQETVEGLEGITFQRNGDVITSPNRAIAKELSPTPLPYELMRLKAYDVANGSINYLSSRGCSYRCAFCAVGKHSGVWKGRTPEQIVSDFDSLRSRFNIRHVRLLDDNFAENPRRVKDICRCLVQAKLEMTWECNGHVNELRLIDQETFDLAREAGMNSITLGVETGSDDTLQLINKGYKRDDLFALLDRISTARISFCTNFMVGLPNEDKAALNKTFSLIRKIAQIYPGNRVKLFLYDPTPGTYLFDYETKTDRAFTYPETLEEWGKIVFNASEPWNPPVRSLLTDYRDRDYVRKKSFYFWIAYLSPFLRRKKVAGPFKYAYGLLHRLVKFRCERNMLAFPAEWFIYKHFHHVIRSRGQQ